MTAELPQLELAQPEPAQPELPEPRLTSEGADWVLIVDRALPQSPDQVWSALTEPDQIRAWLPFLPDRPLTSTGPVLLTDLGNADPQAREAYVHRAEAPNLLVMTWGTDALRWDLQWEPDGNRGATRLTLRHTFADRSQAPSYAAGWHLCMGALAGLLDGHAGPPVVGEAAIEHGYQELFDRYALLLGIGV